MRSLDAGYDPATQTCAGEYRDGRRLPRRQRRPADRAGCGRHAASLGPDLLRPGAAGVLQGVRPPHPGDLHVGARLRRLDRRHARPGSRGRRPARIPIPGRGPAARARSRAAGRHEAARAVRGRSSARSGSGRRGAARRSPARPARRSPSRWTSRRPSPSACARAAGSAAAWRRSRRTPGTRRSASPPAVGGRKLKRGRYRLRVSAVDVAGNARAVEDDRLQGRLTPARAWAGAAARAGRPRRRRRSAGTVASARRPRAPRAAPA